MKIKPLYDTKSYSEYVKTQKKRGLRREFWPDLPKMWKKELKFRRGLERALREFASGG